MFTNTWWLPLLIFYLSKHVNLKFFSSIIFYNNIPLSFSLPPCIIVIFFPDMKIKQKWMWRSLWSFLSPKEKWYLQCDEYLKYFDVFLRDNNYNLFVFTISNLVTLVLLSVNLHFVWLSRISDLAINNLLTSVHTVLELPRAADAIVELSPEDEERLREGLFLYSITLTQSF